ncbi:32506_t:CDS:2 [Racocetra persica]|uniref:32506_t:CDS:1 n=1 Tax=Racocetra persica TaxID=160502 RepID=A0ACA9ML84_9GLOM|nr:32506_t:CDS:2 [Racocetra persica]
MRDPNIKISKYRMICFIVLAATIGCFVYFTTNSNNCSDSSNLSNSNNISNSDNLSSSNNRSISDNLPNSDNYSNSKLFKRHSKRQNSSNDTQYFTWDNKPVNLTIIPNAAYKKIFYGMDYGPVNATYPLCGNTLAILKLNLGMTIVPTIWVDNNDTTYQRQFDLLFNFIENMV